MSWIGRMMGHAGEADLERVQQEYRLLLAEGERIEAAYQVIRDLFLFTNKRLILVDKQGLTGKKVEYLSIPYRSINRFAVETAGHLDLDAELKIWLAGSREPLVKTFHRDLDIYYVQRLLATYILR